MIVDRCMSPLLRGRGATTMVGTWSFTSGKKEQLVADVVVYDPKKKRSVTAVNSKGVASWYHGMPFNNKNGPERDPSVAMPRGGNNGRAVFTYRRQTTCGRC